MKIQKEMALQANPLDRQKAQEAGLRDAAQKYEQHFLDEMVKAMRSTIHRENGFVAPNMAENIFSEKLDQQYTENWAGKGGIGLADMIYSQLHERIFPNRKDFSKPQGPLPLDKASHSMEIKVESKGTPKTGQVTFKGGDGSPLVQATQVTSPWSGKVESKSAQDGWSFVSILHDNQMRSDLAFKGSLKDVAPGTEVRGGDVIGKLNYDSPALRWDIRDLA